MPDSLPLFSLAFIVGTLAVARIGRLIVYDEFPPVLWLTATYQKITRYGAYSKLVECPWCTTPWIALIDAIAAYALELNGLWWFGNLWLAASYLAGLILVRDVPPDQR